jgi:hypothetical protein
MNAIPADCVTLPEAIRARAELVSYRESRREFDYYAHLGVPLDDADAEPYLHREAAVRDLHCSVSEGLIDTYFCDRDTRELMRIPREAWRNLPFWRETIIGGEIQTTACDGMKGLAGQSVFLKRADFEKYLVDVAHRKPASMKADCQFWLERLLRTIPRARRKAKSGLREEAITRFGVTWREFAACWSLANQAVPEAAARRPGRPKKT